MESERPTVVLTCGKAGTGKTTFARQLEVSGFERLSVDEEIRRRLEMGVLSPDADVHLVSISIEEDIRARLVDLVRQRKDVVVDFSFFRRSSRDAYRKLVEDAGGAVELVYFEQPASRPEARRTHETSLDDFIPDFEPPDDDEHPIVIVARTGLDATR
jgi:predicted kinase